MLKSLGVKPYLFPMPVLLIATYDENGTVDVMNMAWGGICAENMVALNLSGDHKTTQNIRAKRAFTISVADTDHIEAADFFGIATGNKMPDKFARSGLHAVKSEQVDAPVVEEFPITLECRVAEIQEQDGDCRIVGEIVNVLADEKVLTRRARSIRPSCMRLCSTNSRAVITAIGDKIGQAWHTGAGLMKLTGISV